MVVSSNQDRIDNNESKTKSSSSKKCETSKNKTEIEKIESNHKYLTRYKAKQSISNNKENIKSVDQMNQMNQMNQIDLMSEEDVYDGDDSSSHSESESECESNSEYDSENEYNPENDSNTNSDIESLSNSRSGSVPSRGRKRFRNDTQQTSSIPISVSKPLNQILRNPCLQEYNKEEKMYYKQLSAKDRKKIALEERKMININDTTTPIRFKILNSNIEDNIKAIAIRKLNSLYGLDPSSGEFHKIFSWIENVCILPIGNYKKLPFNSNNSPTQIKNFLRSAKNHMDATVYGHIDAKDQIIRILAQWIVNPDSKGMVIGIHGPMGCGKTTLIKDGICQVLELPFAFIPLGGASDNCYLEGHSYTYEGATWGKIVDVLMKTKIMNPVFYFDELDKISHTHRGDEIVNKLMHITDLSQNDRFQDKYFIDFDFDISKSLVIFSYNNEELINPILRDRMIRIKTEGYNVSDKINIVQKYILPEITKQYIFAKEDICFPDDIILYIVNVVEKEDGVRNLKRAIENVMSNLNLKRLIEDETVSFPYNVTMTDVHTYLSAELKKSNTFLPMYT
jgi:ATP-dependent Lon protease